MGGVAQEVCGACFVEGPSVLGFLCIAFDFKKFVLRAFFVLIVFPSERAFSIATKVPLRQPLQLFAKKSENRGDSCTGSGQTWPVFSRGLSLLGKVLSEKNGKICVTFAEKRDH